MSHTEIILIAIIALLVVLILSTIFSGLKKIHLELTVADLKMKVIRDEFNDKKYDSKDFTCYRKPNGKRIWISNHFTITKDEVDEVVVTEKK